MSDTKTSTKRADPVYFTRPGYSSPVLRSKKGETVDQFKLRMAKAGWTNLDTVGLHVGPDPSVYHAGSKDKCVLCERQQKRGARVAAKVASANATVKAQAESKAAGTVTENKSLADLTKLPKSITLGQAEKIFSISAADKKDELVKAIVAAGYTPVTKRSGEVTGYKLSDTKVKTGKGKSAKQTVTIAQVEAKKVAASDAEKKENKVEAAKVSTPSEKVGDNVNKTTTA